MLSEIGSVRSIGLVSTGQWWKPAFSPTREAMPRNHGVTAATLNDIEGMGLLFNKLVFEAFDNHWITREIIHLLRQRKRCHKKLSNLSAEYLFTKLKKKFVLKQTVAAAKAHFLWWHQIFFSKDWLMESLASFLLKKDNMRKASQRWQGHYRERPQSKLP